MPKRGREAGAKDSPKGKKAAQGSGSKKSGKKESGSKEKKAPQGKCSVCFDTAEMVSFAEGCMCKCCGPCARGHIQEQMSGGKFNMGGTLVLYCMCQKQMSPNAIQQIARPADRDRYEYLAAKRCVEAMDDFLYCRWPDCGSGQLHEGGVEQPIMTCHHCKRKMCFGCNVKWHAGESCEDFAARRNLWAAEGFETSEELLDGLSSKCPKCKVRVEKMAEGNQDEACDHMTCTACKHEFCWRCLCDMDKVFKHGNHYHKSGCRHYFPYGDK
eukprot:TRINITY_DN11112_c0_g1_i1.p1 TRINITY_DN11112_c0_g1~~TRINITY_DN11112_c0_g1_i1.p1  ORF type:complete len:300 (+),score=119.20 TRINITY_DN11112_c0_g1_i1:92-901(+)